MYIVHHTTSLSCISQCTMLTLVAFESFISRSLECFSAWQPLGWRLEFGIISVVSSLLIPHAPLYFCFDLRLRQEKQCINYNPRVDVTLRAFNIHCSWYIEAMHGSHGGWTKWHFDSVITRRLYSLCPLSIPYQARISSTWSWSLCVCDADFT